MSSCDIPPVSHDDDARDHCRMGRLDRGRLLH